MRILYSFFVLLAYLTPTESVNIFSKFYTEYFGTEMFSSTPSDKFKTLTMTHDGILTSTPTIIMASIGGFLAEGTSLDLGLTTQTPTVASTPVILRAGGPFMLRAIQVTYFATSEDDVEIINCDVGTLSGFSALQTGSNLRSISATVNYTPRNTAKFDSTATAILTYTDVRADTTGSFVLFGDVVSVTGSTVSFTVKADNGTTLRGLKVAIIVFSSSLHSSYGFLHGKRTINVTHPMLLNPVEFDWYGDDTFVPLANTTRYLYMPRDVVFLNKLNIGTSAPSIFFDSKPTAANNQIYEWVSYKSFARGVIYQIGFDTALMCSIYLSACLTANQGEFQFWAEAIGPSMMVGTPGYIPSNYDRNFIFGQLTSYPLFKIPKYVGFGLMNFNFATATRYMYIDLINITTDAVFVEMKFKTGQTITYSTFAMITSSLDHANLYVGKVESDETAPFAVAHSGVQMVKNTFTSPFSFYGYPNVVPILSNFKFQNPAKFAVLITGTTFDSSNYKATTEVSLYSDSGKLAYQATGFALSYIGCCNWKYILPQVLSGFTSTSAQNIYLKADYSTMNYVYVLIMSHYSSYSQATLTFLHPSSNVPRILDIYTFTNESTVNGKAILPKFEMGSSEYLTYHFVKLEVGLNWTICGHYIYLTGFVTSFAADCTNSLFDQFTLSNPLSSYKSLDAQKIFAHNATNNNYCQLKISFSGLITRLYVNNQIIMAGSSLNSSKYVELLSNQIYISPGSYLYITVTGFYLKIQSISLENCKDDSGSTNFIGLVPFNSYGIYAEDFTVMYSSTFSSCGPNCVSCRNSSYCYSCSGGYYMYYGNCYSSCWDVLYSIPSLRLFCSNFPVSQGLRVTAPNFDSNTMTINAGYYIYPFNTVKDIAILFYPFKPSFTNFPFIWNSDSEYTLPQTDIILLHVGSQTENFEISFSKQLGITSNNTNFDLSVIAFRILNDTVQLSEISNTSLPYSYSTTYSAVYSFILINTKIYSISVIVECFDPECFMEITFNGFLNATLNHRTYLFSSYSASNQSFNITKPLSGVNYINIFLSSSTYFDFNFKTNFQLYSMTHFLFYDQVPISISSNCYIQDCTNCLTNSICLSCNPGKYLNSLRSKCISYCNSVSPSALAERRCICSSSEDCLDPKFSKCEQSSCSICDADSDCAHIFFSKNRVKCQDGTCIKCPNYCSDCNNTFECLACDPGYNLDKGICYINCDPGMKNVSQNTCEDICGDGMRPISSSKLSCDDGNRLEGDGCDSFCVVESDYECYGGGPSSKDICGKIPEYILKQDANNPARLVLQFDIPMNLNSSVLKDSISIVLSRSDQSQYNYTITKVDNKTFYLDLIVSKSLMRQILTLTFFNISNIKSQDNIAIKTKTSQTSIQGIKFTSETTKELTKNVETIGQVASTAVAISSASIMFSGSNPALIYGLVNLLQIYYYLLLINVDLPDNVEGFFNIFALGRLTIIPNVFENYLKEFEIDDLYTPKRFLDQSMSSYFIINSGSMLVLLGGSFVIYLICLIQPYIRASLPRLINALSRTYQNMYEWNLALKLFELCFLDISISFFLQLQQYSFKDMPHSISTGLAITFLFGSIYVMCICLRVISDYRFRRDKDISKYYSIIGGLRIDNLLGFHYTFIQYIRRIFMAATLVYAQNYPYAQVVLLMCIHVIPFLINIAHTPYYQLREIVSHGVEETCYFFIHLLILIVCYDNYNSIFDDDFRNKIGWAMIGLCLTSLGASLICIGIQQYEELLKLKNKIKIFYYNFVLSESSKKKLSKDSSRSSARSLYSRFAKRPRKNYEDEDDF